MQVPRNMTLSVSGPALCRQTPGGPRGGAWQGKRAVVSLGWGTKAGGLDGLGEKPEGMTRRHKATPTCPSLRKWPGPSSGARQPRQGRGQGLRIQGLSSCGLLGLGWAPADGGELHGRGCSWVSGRGEPLLAGLSPPNHTYPTVQAGFWDLL